MKQQLRRLIPNEVVNIAWHLPKAVIASVKAGFPARGMRIIGVTGTDGKTTTSNMIYRILEQAGKKAALISTINALIDGKAYDTGFHVTSPDAMILQQYIKKAKEAGCEFLVLEITSHALDQYRAWGVPIEIGVITNITHEHLDYHKTFYNYRQAKAKLIKSAKVAVLNRDDSNFNYLKHQTNGRVISFGFEPMADVSVVKSNVQTNMVGDFNLLNAAAATGVAQVLGIDEQTIHQALTKLPAVDGRMEEIENSRGLKVFLDFAHTPNGLEQALKSLRKLGKGKLIAVFGSAGYRDVSKRSLMGQVGAQWADLMVVTAEDPRGLIEQINAAILTGALAAGGKLGETIFVEIDRQKAIDLAINKLAKKGDIVGVFGKGHEQSLNMDGKTEIPWSDKKAIERALKG